MLHLFALTFWTPFFQRLHFFTESAENLLQLARKQSIADWLHFINEITINELVMNFPGQIVIEGFDKMDISLHGQKR